MAEIESSESDIPSRPSSLPPGYVDQAEATRISGIGITAWKRWLAEGKITFSKRLTLPGGGWRHIYSIDGINQMMRDVNLSFPPPGTVDIHEAARVLDVSTGTFGFWETQGRITGGQLVAIPGKSGQRKVYPIEEIRQLAEEIKRNQEEAGRRLDPYPDPGRPGIVRVPVASGKHEWMEALIDDADLPLVAPKRWNWSPGKPGRRIGGSVILVVDGTPKPSLTRILLGMNDPEQLVCHLNGDRLDCRRENLVVRTRREVRLASKKLRAKAGKACSSQFKGVTCSESGRKWNAAITLNGKTRGLGCFRNEVEAALAYDAAMTELIGENVADLNLPDPAEAKRLRALEPVSEDGPFPPRGMVDRHEACRMFGVALKTWTTWEQRGRITCGQYHPLPNDKPGRCKLYPKDELERNRAEIEKLGKPYADADRPGVWRVPLKSYLAYREVLIDEADLPIVEGKNWNWNDQIDGTVEGRVILATTERQLPLHRLIAGVTDPDTRVCFVNGDALDCRRANLVVRTLAEMVHTNRKREMTAGKECTSRFKGVSYDPKRGKWVAQISRSQVHKGIGRFDDELAAAEAYDDCARVWLGDHAYVNFPHRASTETNRLWAQRVMDGTVAKERLRRQRQKKLERKLKGAAHEARHAGNALTLAEREAMRAAGDAVPMIRRSLARKLFGVPRLVWKRWRRLGWLPDCAIAAGDGKKWYRLDEIERLLRRCGKVVLPYPDPERPDVYRVPLSGERTKGREALIDADAVHLVQSRRWRFAPTDSGRGGEVQTMNPSENIRLHYLVMGASGNDGCHIGHRNDDPLDCRRANLVVRTLTETAANRRKQATFCGRPCSSRFKGVYREKRRNRWAATIKKDRVQYRLGSFHDEIAAAQAYDEAARELFGEHARPNFPAGVDARLAANAEVLEKENCNNTPAPDAARPALTRAA